MSTTKEKREQTPKEIQQVVEVVNKQEPKKQSFVRQLVSDSNSLNEPAIVGFICFILFVAVVIVDIVAPALVIEKTYITHLVALITGCFGIGAAKSYREVMKKTVVFEKPEE